MVEALVDPAALRTLLTQQGATGRALGLVDAAAEQASTYVGAHCSRLRPGDPVPMIVARVALAVAARTAQNPGGIRSVSAEGQQSDLPPVGLTYWESTLLAPYRRRSA